jgi:hypothetical protein
MESNNLFDLECVKLSPVGYRWFNPHLRKEYSWGESLPLNAIYYGSGDEWECIGYSSGFQVVMDIVTKHHHTSIASLVNPLDKQDWKTGLIPDPRGPSVLYIERLSTPFWATACRESNGVWWCWIYDGFVVEDINDMLQDSDVTGRWFIQRIDEPFKPAKYYH